MRLKQIIIIVLFFVFFPAPLLAKDNTKEYIDFLVTVLTIGGAITTSVLFFLNKIETAKKEAISHFQMEIKELQDEFFSLKEKHEHKIITTDKEITVLYHKVENILKAIKTIELRSISLEDDVTDIFSMLQKVRRRRARQPNPDLFGMSSKSKPEPISSLIKEEIAMSAVESLVMSAVESTESLEDET